MSQQVDELQQTLNDLDLESSPSEKTRSGKVTNVKTRALGSDRLVLYPPLPSQAATDDHYYGFGWEVSEKWLQKFGVKHSPIFKGRRNACGDIGVGIMELKKFSGYKFIKFYPVAAEGGEAPSLESLEHGEFSKDESNLPPKKHILALSFNRSRYYMIRRPTERSFEVLKKIIPGEPRWHRGYWPKKWWSDTLYAL